MKNKNKKQTTYPKEIYTKILINNLIMFGIQSLINRKEKCTFEKLIKECFYLFPKVFSFARYPQWPDSLKLDRQLRTLREKGYISGNPRTSFFLTRFGKRITENTKKFLENGITTKIITSKIFRDSDINFINSLKTSEVFQKFLKNKKKFLITEMELRNILHCTLETPSRILRQNLVYGINLAKEFKEENLLKFLKLCQQSLNKK